MKIQKLCWDLLGCFCSQVSSRVTRRIQSPLIPLKLTSGAKRDKDKDFFSPLPPVSSTDNHCSVCLIQHIIHFPLYLGVMAVQQFPGSWATHLQKPQQIFFLLLKDKRNYKRPITVGTVSIPSHTFTLISSLYFLKISFFHVQRVSPVCMKRLATQA